MGMREKSIVLQCLVFEFAASKVESLAFYWHRNCAMSHEIWAWKAALKLTRKEKRNLPH